MQDYQGNSNKARNEEGMAKEKPVAKNIMKVVTGDAIIPKKSVGTKFKETFLDPDNMVTVGGHIWTRWLLPAGKSLLGDVVDSLSDSAQRKLFGDRGGIRRSFRPGQGSRMTYNAPVNRGGSSPLSRGAPALELGPRMSSRHATSDVLLQDRDEADVVLEHMNAILEQFDVVSVGDLKALIGSPDASHVDETIGWTDLRGSNIRTTANGYLLELPPVERLK